MTFIFICVQKVCISTRKKYISYKFRSGAKKIKSSPYSYKVKERFTNVVKVSILSQFLTLDSHRNADMWTISSASGNSI